MGSKVLRMEFSNDVSTEKQIPIHFSSVSGEGWKDVKEKAAEWRKDPIVYGILNRFTWKFNKVCWKWQICNWG